MASGEGKKKAGSTAMGGQAAWQRQLSAVAMNERGEDRVVGRKKMSRDRGAASPANV